ncbi:uncharacterized protein N7473_000088 [Penicillium subrubescens]|uniref:uncharacterized protein n=1 Tax=Penicillium subrubescens TaxID=1316194 RepID=UPI00254531ED|nr:uncharacterized protein N7473_000088 [Penicillium subrubescens]KAJ5910785.1 hypothetical protein N7473_000088 [Penicillium subrubescens]
MGAGSWTESEDQILRREYARQGAENTSCTTRWDAIASCLPGRTSRDVRKRWINVLENQFNKGAWTKSEDDRLRIAVQLHGTRWVNVAKDVGTRSADQCSKRWNQHLDPALVPSQWTQDKAVLASISDAPPCCQNEASGSQNTTVPLGIMTPLSDTSLWNLQSVPWTPAFPETIEDYTITGVGSPTSDFFSSQLDVLHYSLPSDMTINYSALLDSGTIQEARDTFSLVDGDLSPLDPSSSASSAQEVSLVIQNPDQNLITRMVNELVTAKVDFKVVQGST